VPQIKVYIFRNRKDTKLLQFKENKQFACLFIKLKSALIKSARLANTLHIHMLLKDMSFVNYSYRIYIKTAKLAYTLYLPISDT